MPDWFEPLLETVKANIDLAEPLVFLLGFAESMVFLSLMVPSSALFLGIGGLHSAAGGTFVSVWLAATAGAVIGDLITFFIGRYFRKDVHRIWPISARPGWYAFAKVYVRRHGAVGVFASKFGGIIRPFVPLVAGAMGMRWYRFVPASVLSCFMWSGVFLAPGYALTSAFTWGQ